MIFRPVSGTFPVVRIHLKPRSVSAPTLVHAQRSTRASADARRARDQYAPSATSLPRTTRRILRSSFRKRRMLCYITYREGESPSCGVEVYSIANWILCVRHGLDFEEKNVMLREESAFENL